MRTMKHISLRNAIALVTILGSIAAAPLALAARTAPQTHAAGLSAKKSDTGPRKGLGGTVTAISGTTITISSGPKNENSYSVDASKARISGSKAKMMTDIHIGDTLAVIGRINGTSIAAKTIIDRPVGEGTPKSFLQSHKTKTTH